MVKYVCQNCKSEFGNKTDYDRHLARLTDCTLDQKKRKITQHICEHCDKVLSRKDSLVRHLKTCKVKIQNINNNNKNNNNKNNNNKNNNNKNNNNNNNNNKNANNKHSKNNVKGNNNFNKVTINNNIQLPITIDKSHLNGLSTKDEMAIFNSKENPMIMIITFTHLAEDKPQYHNIGYNDDHSGTGYLFNGQKFVKKQIKHITREVLENRLKDLEKLHKQVSRILSEKLNREVEEKLDRMNKMLWGKLNDPAQQARYLKDLNHIVAMIKNILYTKRNLFQEAYNKINVWNGYDDSDDIPEMNPIVYGVKPEFQSEVKLINYRDNQRLKQEMAVQLLDDMKDIIDEKNYQSLTNMIDEADIEQLNIINRLLRKSYCFHKKINCKIIEDEIKNEELVAKFLE